MKDKKQQRKRPEQRERHLSGGIGQIKKEFIIELDGKPYVLYAGLLQLAHEQGLKSLCTELIQTPSVGNDYTAIVKATVVTRKGTFVDYGDANYASVGDLKYLPHVIRCASTRAKARALRDAVNVGITAVEELPVGNGNGSKKEGRPADELISARQLETLMDMAEKLDLPNAARSVFPTMTKSQASAKIEEYGRALRAARNNQKGEGWEGGSLTAAHS